MQLRTVIAASIRGCKCKCTLVTPLTNCDAYTQNYETAVWVRVYLCSNEYGIHKVMYVEHVF